MMTESKLPTRTSKQKGRIVIKENVICYHKINKLSESQDPNYVLLLCILVHIQNHKEHLLFS